MICHGPRAAVSDVDGPCSRSRSAGHRVGVRPGTRSCPSQHRRRTERPEKRDAERRKAPWSHVIDVHYTREQWYVLFEDECIYIYMRKALEHVLGLSSAARVQGSGRRPVLGVKEAPGRGRASRGPCDPVPDAEDDDDLALAAEILQQRQVGERGRPRPSSSLHLLPCRGGRGGRGFLL